MPVAFTAMLVAVSLISIGTLSRHIRSLEVDSIPGLASSVRIASQGRDVRIKMNASLVDLATNSGQESSRFERELAAAQTRFQEALKAHEAAVATAGERQLLEAVRAAYRRAMEGWPQARAAAAGNAAAGLALFRSEVLPAFEEMQQVIDKLAAYNQANAAESVQAASAAASTAKWWSWVVALVAVACGSVFSFFTARSINRVLAGVVEELSASAGQVAAAASQVSASSQSLAQGASEQAASLEETSASSEEINSMARRNTENSRVAADLVAKSQQHFSDTNQALGLMVSAMEEISESSGKISKIIKVIDEIAFQTNILALNAAVEAARAGEAGLGFAVVADEVRNLAQRCAQAAKDTSALIEESIVKANNGKVKVDQVAAAVEAITEASARVKTLVEEVNLGSQEQARGIEEIGKAIVEVEQVTQRTAAGAEESASAAEELRSQSDVLREVVRRLAVLVEGEDAADREVSRAVRSAA
jgi:methyl-accepting chemotaxis protein